MRLNGSYWLTKLLQQKMEAICSPLGDIYIYIYMWHYHVFLVEWLMLQINHRSLKMGK